MDALGLSLTMVVCDEGHRLGPMLAWHRPLVDDVVIVVQESTDDTRYMAKSFADTVIEHPRYGYCEASRQAASVAARHDRQLVLDADEQVTLPLALALQWLTARLGRAVQGYRIRRRFWRDGVLEFAGDAQHRLLYRPNALFLDEIHTEPQSRAGWAAVPTWGEPDILFGIEHIKTTAEQLADEDRCHALLSDGGALAGDPLRAQKLALNVHRRDSELGIRDSGINDSTDPRTPNPEPRKPVRHG